MSIILGFIIVSEMCERSNKESFFKRRIILKKMKIKQFRTILKEKRLQAALFITPDPNLVYFTQVNPSFGLLYVTPQEAQFHVSKLDQRTCSRELKTIFLEKGWEKKLAQKKVKRIGINKEHLTLALADKIKKIFPKAKLVDVSPELKKLRADKTPEEIKKIRKAAKITSTVFSHLLIQLKKKKLKTEQDVAQFIHEECFYAGADLAFPTIVASAKNSAIPHHQTSLSKLQRGFLLLDFGAKYENYCSDMSRTLFLGQPTKEEKEKYQMLLQVQEKTIEFCRHKPSLYAAERFSRKELGKYVSYFVHSLGHGVGTEIHEEPYSRKRGLLPQNSIFTIEPGIYFPHKFGIRIEDTLFWNGKKIEILTKAPKELIVLPW